MMGTRSGSVDPGILLYLLRSGYGAAELDRVLNQESGLQGLSGISADMGEITAAAGRGEARARLAFDVYVHRLCREIGGMAAALTGVDALAFTGGIGENSADVREAACRRLRFLGVELDEPANRLSPIDSDIATPHSPVRIVVVRSGEEVEIARLCRDVMTSPRREGEIRWNPTPDGATLSPGRR
jgi:acetate kinase